MIIENHFMLCFAARADGITLLGRLLSIAMAEALKVLCCLQELLEYFNCCRATYDSWVHNCLC